MPRKPRQKHAKAKSLRIPTYCLHKPTGLAYVTLGGKQTYLGKFQLDADGKPDCPEYHRLIAEYLKAGEMPPAPPTEASPLTIAELLAQHWAHAEKRYRKPDGTPSGELDALRAALRPVNRLFGDTPARDFGPKRFKLVREEMKRLGWCRLNINRQLSRVRRMFRWAVEEELVDGSLYHSLQAVAALRANTSEVRESLPVRPVHDGTIDATLRHLAPTVAAMVRLQLWTGMRPGELVIMRACDIEMTTGDGAEVWTYRPATHKNAHRGQAREIPLGPKARDLVRGFLGPKMDAYLFVPSVEGGTSERYDVASYRRAIARACDRAFPLTPTMEAERLAVEKWACKWAYAHKDKRPRLADYPKDIAEKRNRVEEFRQANRWHPHRLRHNFGTAVRKKYGAENSQVMLGHSELSTTEIYAERNLERSRMIAEQIG